MLSPINTFIYSLKINRDKGFTLIEILIVIIILAILASLAMPAYYRYQIRAQATAYALPYARACLMDLISFCMNHPGANITDDIVQKLENCRALGMPNAEPRTRTPDGNIIVAAPRKIETPELSNVVIDKNAKPPYDVRALNLSCTKDGKLVDTGTGKKSADVSVLLGDPNYKLLGFEYTNGTGGGTTYAECSYYPDKGIKCIITENPQDF